MAEHNVLTGSSLHEPKDIAAAASNQLYFADGAGSGDMELAVAYGGIGLFNHAGSAVSGIGTTPIALAVFTADMPAADVVPAHGSDNITITTAGDYAVHFYASFATSAAGDAGDYQFRLRVGGVEGSGAQNLGCHREMSGSSDEGSVSFAGIATFSAADVLSIYVESDDGGNNDDIDLLDVTLFVTLLKA